MKKIYLFFLFLLLILIAFLFLFSKGRPFSKKFLELEILGPSEIKAGEEYEYQLRYKNASEIALEEPKILFECPPLSLKCEFLGNEESQKRDSRIEIFLSSIPPNEEKTFSFKIQLLGKENEEKEIKASLSFRPQGLKAIYFQESSFKSLIKEVPIFFDLDMPETVEKNKEFEFFINYLSDLNLQLSNLKILLEYPSGFLFLESSPEASYSNNEYTLSILEPQKPGQIKIKGSLKDETNKKETFKGKLIIVSEEEEFVLKEVEKPIAIFEPLIDISQKINGSDSSVLKKEERLNYEVFVRNNGDLPIENQTLKIKLEGKALDFSTLNPGMGKYDKDKGLIVWDGESVSFLKKLESQEEGRVDFSIGLKSGLDFNTEEQRKIKSKIEFDGFYTEFEREISP